MRTLFITGARKANRYHAALAKAINADFFYSNFNRTGYDASSAEKVINTLKAVLTLPRNYDVYLSETVFVIPALARRLGKIKKTAKIINISADPVLYNLNHAEKKSIFDIVHSEFIRDVDAFIMVGDWRYLLRRLDIHTPVLVVEAGTPDKLYEFLMKIPIERRKDNHDIIFAGHLNSERMRYKGMDLLLKAAKLLEGKYPDIRIFVTGDSKIDDAKVVLTGFKESDKEFAMSFADKALCVNMGRGDTFPLATIEAMQAGIPTLVSNETGTKKVIASAEKSFVLPLNAEVLAKKIDWYFNLSKQEKIRLSKRFREAARSYKESTKIEEFSSNYNYFLRKL